MNNKISQSPSYKWWVVFMLWFICLFNYADRQAISSVFVALEKEFSFTATQLGYIARRLATSMALAPSWLVL